MEKRILISTHSCIHCVPFPMKKDTGFRIRVQSDLRDKFVELCREQDKPAAQVLREYMREYAAEHKAANDGVSNQANDTRKKPKKGR